MQNLIKKYTMQFKSYEYTVNPDLFANSVKIHICDFKISRLGSDIPACVNDRVISSFREGFIFTKLRVCEVSRK